MNRWDLFHKAFCLREVTSNMYLGKEAIWRSMGEICMLRCWMYDVHCRMVLLSNICFHRVILQDFRNRREHNDKYFCCNFVWVWEVLGFLPYLLMLWFFNFWKMIWNLVIGEGFLFFLSTSHLNHQENVLRHRMFRNVVLCQLKMREIIGEYFSEERLLRNAFY